MVRRNNPAMNRRMNICDMALVAKPIFTKYQKQLVENGWFDANAFVGELSQACRCYTGKTIFQMLTDLWHATKDASLLYYFDRSGKESDQFRLYVAQAYGFKKYYIHTAAECRALYWRKFFSKFRTPQSS